jgi:hypothetical protein
MPRRRQPRHRIFPRHPPRIMPKGLQITTLKKRFIKANKALENPQEETSRIAWEKSVDGTLSFSENLYKMKRDYPLYCWGVKKTAHKKTWDIHENNFVTVYSTHTKIKPITNTVKNKKYGHGRIQITVPEEWIGETAKVIVKLQKRKS